MMKMARFNKILHWLKTHPGIFTFQEDNRTLQIQELSSKKVLSLKESQIEGMEEKTNRTNPNETYLVLLLHHGYQLVLAAQGFAFAPDFSNTGPLNLPSQVYCMQDFHQLFHQLQHVAAESDRQREALDLIMILIAILDGAKIVGLEVEEESKSVEQTLAQIEKGVAPKH